MYLLFLNSQQIAQNRNCLDPSARGIIYALHIYAHLEIQIFVCGVGFRGFCAVILPDGFACCMLNRIYVRARYTVIDSERRA